MEQKSLILWTCIAAVLVIAFAIAAGRKLRAFNKWKGKKEGKLVFDNNSVNVEPKK